MVNVQSVRTPSLQSSLWDNEKHNSASTESFNIEILKKKKKKKVEREGSKQPTLKNIKKKRDSGITNSYEKSMRGGAKYKNDYTKIVTKR